MKKEVLKKWNGDVRGYKIGDYYLLKHYTWGNKYNWIISKEDFYAIMSCEVGKLFDEKRIEFVPSKKDGIEIILNRLEEK